MLKSEAKFHQI